MPLFSAVPPSDMLTNIQTDKHGTVSAIAHHRRDGRCEAIYVVDAISIGPGLWKRADGWQDPDRLIPATSLTQVGDIWQARVTWRPRAERPEIVGIALCIVPESSTMWFTQGVQGLAGLPAGGATPSTGASPEHVAAIQAAFAEEEKGLKFAWFSGAVLSA